MENIINSKKKLQSNMKAVLGTNDDEVSHDLSFGSDLKNSEDQKYFSFNQSLNSIEQNEKMIIQRSSNLPKIKKLEDDIKIYKNKSNLWDKVKKQILNLNKILKLSSVNMNCSDTAIMKEFFDYVEQLLNSKEEKKKQEKSKVSEMKKKENEIYEKLVQSNKRKYELEQMVVQLQSEIEKLTEFNDGIKEKSRSQSNERTGQIKEFHQQTMLTIHQKDQELEALEEKNNELKIEIQKKEKQTEQSREQLKNKQKQYETLLQENSFLLQQLKNEKGKVKNFVKQQEDTHQQIQQIKSEMKMIVQQNLMIREQLGKRGECIKTLRKVFLQAKKINDENLIVIQDQKKKFEQKKLKDLRQLQEKQSNQRNFERSVGIKKEGLKLLLRSKSVQNIKKIQPMSSQQLLI